MRETRAGDAGLVALAGAYGGLAQLRHLDLRHNPVGNPGIGALADALGSAGFASLARLFLHAGGNARLLGAVSDRRIELSGGTAFEV